MFYLILLRIKCENRSMFRHLKISVDSVDNKKLNSFVNSIVTSSENFKCPQSERLD